MFKLTPVSARTCSRLGQRGSIFGLAAPEAAKNDARFVLMTADLATLSGMERYMKQYPGQFLNIGIAEQNMVGIGAGLSAEGYLPCMTTYATFITMRSCEQIRHFFGYMGLRGIIIGSGAGLSQGFAGNTHYTIEDISILKAIPGITILSPADAGSAVKIFNESLGHGNAVYLRLTGNLDCPIVYKEDVSFPIGGSHLVKEGEDIAILACGTMVHTAMKTAEILDSKGMRTDVIDMYSIKPLDTFRIDGLADKKLIVTVEEHNTVGGLGGSVAEYVSTRRGMPPVLRLGIKDDFDLAGDYEGLLERNGLTPQLLTDTIISAYDF